MAISKLKAGSIASGTLDNARISLDAAEIPNIPADKITSGTFADSRLSASSVNQHATDYDDNTLKSNVALLGFKTLEEVIGQSSLLEFKEETRDHQVYSKRRYQPFTSLTTTLT